MARADETLFVKDDHACSPIASPDGSKVVYTRIGTSEEGPQGEVMVVDSRGAPLAKKRLAEGFAVAWTEDSERIVCHCGSIARLVALDGSSDHEAGMLRPGGPPAFLSTLDELVWKQDGRVIRPDGAGLPSPAGHEAGNLLAPSPGGRYLASLYDTADWSPLRVYDFEKKTWRDLGVVQTNLVEGLHWDRMVPPWSPWTQDGSHIAFVTTANDVVLATPDGAERVVVAHPEKRATTPVPSPGGTMVAFVVHEESRPPRSWVAVGMPDVGTVVLTSTVDMTTNALTWLGDDAIVFDRLDEYRTTQLWRVRVPR